MRRTHLIIAALLVVGCESSPKKAGPEAASRATASAQGPATATASTKAAAPSAKATGDTTASPLDLSAPKAYGFTEKAAIGTLPQGVGIEPGEKAPDFELKASDGQTVSLSDLLETGEVLLTFYRGGW